MSHGADCDVCGQTHYGWEPRCKPKEELDPVLDQKTQVKTSTCYSYPDEIALEWKRERDEALKEVEKWRLECSSMGRLISKSVCVPTEEYFLMITRLKESYPEFYKK